MEYSMAMPAGQNTVGADVVWPWRRMAVCLLLGTLAAWSLDLTLSRAINDGVAFEAVGSAVPPWMLASLRDVTVVKVLESGFVFLARAILWALCLQGILLLGGWETSLPEMIACFSTASLAFVARDLTKAILIVVGPHGATTTMLNSVPLSLASLGPPATGPLFQIRAEINLFEVGWFVIAAWMLRRSAARLPAIAAMLALWLASLTARVGLLWYVARLAGN